MARGVAWNTIGTAFNQGSTFLVTIILARLLARQAFGEYAMIQTTMSVVSTIAQLSCGYTATRYVAELRDRDAARAGRVLGLCGLVSCSTGLIAAVALLFLAHRLAVFLHAPGLTTGFMIASGAVFFSVTIGFLNGALAGLESYSSYGRAGVVAGFAYAVLGIGGAWFGGVNGALGGIVLSGCAQALLLWAIVRREARRLGISVNVHEAWEERAIMFRFSLPAALNGFVTLPAIWTANAILARQSGGFQQVALFSAANSFRIIVLFLPNILNTVGISVLNNHRGAGDEVRFRRLFRTNLVFSAGVVLVGGTAIGSLGPWLLRIFGPGFEPAYPVLLALMLAATAETLSLVAFQIIHAQERLWLSFFGVALPYAIALVVTTEALAPASGAVGLAWAYVVSWSVALGVEWLIVWRVGVWTPSRFADEREIVGGAE
jgi:O-antigen/teichoic acid export membrane protein